MNIAHAERVYFEQIKRTVPLSAVLARYGVLDNLKRVGRQLCGACPIHGGANKRQFCVDLQKNVWKCFSPDCGSGGSLLEFVAGMENVDIREAALRVAEWFAIRAARGQAQRKQRRRHVSNTPSFKVFSVADREWKDPNTGEVKKGPWTRIGTAFEIEGGYSIAFDALPVPTIYDGKVQTRIVLQPFESEDEAPAPPKKVARK